MADAQINPHIKTVGPWLLFLLVLAGIIYLIGINARVSEDAYISFRVVDNFVNGYGLRWNTHERVQVFTNPLWMMVHIPFYAIWENIFVICMVLSFACTLGAIAIAYRTFGYSALPFTLLFLLPLLGSRAFNTHSASGLENPMMHILYAWFGWVLLKAKPERFWFWLAVPTALSMVNRLDTVVIFAPVWVYLLVSRFRDIRFKQLIAGSLPITSWLLFALFYFGFIFPNTMYSKLGAGISSDKYFRQGLNYLSNLTNIDMASSLWLAAAAIITLYLVVSSFWKRENRLLASVGLGVVAYSLYVISVGGSHTFGLFWTLPVFSSVWLIAVFTKQLKDWKIIASAIAMVVLLTFSTTPLKQLRNECTQCFKGMLNLMNLGEPTLTKYLQGRLRLPVPSSMRQHVLNKLGPVTSSSRIGILGYKAGPELIIIDRMGLPDAFIARLPGAAKRIHRIGHMGRSIPIGYRESLKTGDLSLMNPDLQEYYKPLRQIVSGDLWSLSRLITIAAFNMGVYDEYRDAYLASRTTADIEAERQENIREDQEFDNALNPISRRQNPSDQSSESTDE